MISTDNIVDIFLFNPSLDLFNSFGDEQKEEVLKRITLSEIMLHSWQQNMLKIRDTDIVDQAVIDKREDVLISIIDNFEGLCGVNHFVSHCLDRIDSIHFDSFIIYVINLNYLESITQFAAKNNRVDLIEECVNRGFEDYYRIARIAAENGHISLFKKMLSLCVESDMEFLMMSAAECGQIEIARLLIDVPVSHRIITYSAKGGSIEIIKLLNIPVKYYDYVAKVAVFHGNTELVNYILQTQNDIDLNPIAFNAAKRGHTKIAEDMIRGFLNKDGVHVRADNIKEIAKCGNAKLAYKYSNSSTDWNEVADWAIKDGEILSLIIEKDVTIHSHIIDKIAMNGHLDIIRKLNTGNLNWNTIASNAAKGNHIDVVRYAIEKGANNWKNIVENVSRYGDKEFIIELFERSKYDLMRAFKEAEDDHNFRNIDVDNLINIKYLNFGVHLDCKLYFNL